MKKTSSLSHTETCTYSCALCIHVNIQRDKQIKNRFIIGLIYVDIYFFGNTHTYLICINAVVPHEYVNKYT